jgi:c-di-GMP phosphodiesterase
LDAAKRSKLYPKITIAMLEKSFAAFSNSEYGFSVNLSNEDIENSEITDYLLLLFEKFPNLCKRAQVAIEILETEGIVNYPKVYDFTHRLKELYGCKLAIDDFGAGYSNFTHILQLKVDYLKIDSSLIKEIDTSKEAQAIVRTVVAFSKELGISTIAEFVHSKEVHDKVKELGVDYAQGYYIGKPQASF